MNVHCSFSSNSPKLETTQMSINWGGLDNQIVVRPHHRVNHSAREGNRPPTHTAMQTNPTRGRLRGAGRASWCAAGLWSRDLPDGAQQGWPGQVGGCRGTRADGNWGTGRRPVPKGRRETPRRQKCSTSRLLWWLCDNTHICHSSSNCVLKTGGFYFT